MIAKTVDRVIAHTKPEVNERIRERTQRRIALAAAGGADAVLRRLEDLDREWDIERVLELQASAITVLGLILGGVKRERRWFLLSGLVQGFMLQHATQGWCPPVPALRWLGFRTQQEIEEERCALMELEL